MEIYLYSVRIQENTDQQKFRIWTLFTQCCSRFPLGEFRISGKQKNWASHYFRMGWVRGDYHHRLNRNHRGDYHHRLNRNSAKSFHQIFLCTSQPKRNFLKNSKQGNCEGALFKQSCWLNFSNFIEKKFHHDCSNAIFVKVSRRLQNILEKLLQQNEMIFQIQVHFYLKKLKNCETSSKSPAKGFSISLKFQVDVLRFQLTKTPSQVFFRESRYSE